MQPSRRTFLASAAAVGIGTAWPATPKPHRIDVHHHVLPPAYIAEMHATPADWTPAKSIEDMDRSGIAASVLSVSPPGVWNGNVEQGRRMARVINDYAAKMAKDYPGRFGLFSALPLPDVEGSLREISYALDMLKADGVGLLTSYGDKWLGDALFRPIWEELNRRKAVIYTHPSAPACCMNLKYEISNVSIEYTTDTSRTMASLLFSGTASRFPDIRWIFSHGGGTMPFLLSRFQYEERTMKDKTRLPKGLMFELGKFYYDTAQANHAGALDALLKIVQPSQIVYGTDFPYRLGGEANGGLGAYHFPARTLHAIERDNALRLLPELKTA